LRGTRIHRAKTVAVEITATFSEFDETIGDAGEPVVVGTPVVVPVVVKTPVVVPVVVGMPVVVTTIPVVVVAQLHVELGESQTQAPCAHLKAPPSHASWPGALAHVAGIELK
jgi:hypothetical protein